MIKRIQNLKISFKLYILVGVALIGMLIIGGMSFNLMEIGRASCRERV